MSKDSWSKVRELWHKAYVFGSTVSSVATMPPLSEAEYKERRDRCFGSLLRGVPVCEFLIETNNGSFCGSCGCGTNRLAKLGEGRFDKLLYPGLKCPEGKF